MKIQTFIFVHDQHIVLDCRKRDAFKGAPALKYIFLGKGDVELIRHFPDVVVCRELPVNLEAYPKLTSFSGWYAIWANKLYEADFLNLFEYDIALSGDFNQVVLKETEAGLSILAYVPLRVHNPLFVQDPSHIGNLLSLIEHHHHQDAIPIIEGMDQDRLCSATSNHTFERRTFERYMEWMNPMIDGFKDHPMAGHMMERSISLYYLLNQVEDVRLRMGVLTHYQGNSHKTYPFALARERGSRPMRLGQAFSSVLVTIARKARRLFH